MLLKKMKTEKMKRQSSGRAVPLTQSAKAWDRYRQNYNPVRGLTIARAVSLIESYLRGEYADFMWALGAPAAGIESADADLFAIIERRTAAVGEMDWNAKPSAKSLVKKFGSLADEQAAFVRERMEVVENLDELVPHLEMAAFRGFAVAEKILRADGSLERFELVEPWNVVREGYSGGWRYNPQALYAGYDSLGVEMDILPEGWVIFENPRAIGRIAIIKFVRQNLSQKDWDAFVEIYGIPRGIIVGPPNVADETAFAQTAEAISTGDAGYLPNGSTYTANDSPRGVNPFRDHLKYLQEQLVLAGTGGKLTMLAESGSGTLAGGAHSDTFKQIARWRAKAISRAVSRQVVEPMLRAQWPGMPALAYWELAYREEVEAGAVIDHAVKLAQAGYRMDAAELSEKTGYKISEVRSEKLEVKSGSGVPPLSIAEVRSQNAEVKREALLNGGLGSGRKPEGRSVPDAPRLIKPSEAAALLSKGFDHEGQGGRRFHFGEGLVKKFSQKPDGDKRLAHLPHAMETLKNPWKVKPQNNQDMFLGKYKVPKGEVHVFVFADKKGKVSDVTGYYTPTRKQFDREMKNSNQRSRLWLGNSDISVSGNDVEAQLDSMPAFEELKPKDEVAQAKEFLKPAASHAVAGALGIDPLWLEPVAKILDDLARQAEGGEVDDAELAKALEAAAAKLPELFGEMDAGEFAKILEAGMAEALKKGQATRGKGKI